MRIVAIALSLLAIAMVAAGVTLFLDPATGREGQETLARFGTYFGGVEAPLLALLTIVGLALTLMLQNRQLQIAQEDRLLARHIRMLDEAWHDMEKLEATPLRRASGRMCTFKDIFDGTVDTDDVGRSALAATSSAYLRRLGTYAKGVHLFRDNFDAHWDHEVLVARGNDAVARIKPLLGLVGSLATRTLALIEHDLNGTT